MWIVELSDLLIRFLAGKAADEMHEETGIKMAPEDLIDMTALTMPDSTQGVFLSPVLNHLCC
jgi:hypothetical protein